MPHDRFILEGGKATSLASTGTGLSFVGFPRPCGKGSTQCRCFMSKVSSMLNELEPLPTPISAPRRLFWLSECSDVFYHGSWYMLFITSGVPPRYIFSKVLPTLGVRNFIIDRATLNLCL